MYIVAHIGTYTNITYSEKKILIGTYYLPFRYRSEPKMGLGFRHQIFVPSLLLPVTATGTKGLLSLSGPHRFSGNRASVR